MNLEFDLNDTVIEFKPEPLNNFLQSVYDKALRRAAKYAVAEAELLESIIEIDQHRLHEKLGVPHLTPFCIKHFNLSESVAANFVRVARKSQTVPALQQAVETGEIDISKARTISSVITPENQSEWIEKAANLSKANLEREVAAASPKASKPEKAKPISADRVRVEFELSHEMMQLFRRCQDLVCQSQCRAVDLETTQEAMIRSFLKHHDPVLKAQRAAAKKTRKETKFRDEQKSSAEDNMHRSQDRSTPHGKTPASVTHEVNLRDGKSCRGRCPDGSICGETRFTQHHHIIKLSEGGTDTADNIITLCSAHHRMWHRRDNLRSPQVRYGVPIFS